ncbi:MAG: hypothetical protein AAGF97_04235 [Planctomycetota bacterium]
MTKTLTLACFVTLLLAGRSALDAQTRDVEHTRHALTLPLPKGDGIHLGRGGRQQVEINLADFFSYDLQGAIPPNHTVDFNIADALGQHGGAYDVVGLGWEVTIDAFGPSWLSDVSISLGPDPNYQRPALVLVPGLGDDFFDLRTYESGGVRDLTNWNGTGEDFSFQTNGELAHLELFESYDDFIGFPDAWFRNPSVLTLEVIRVPEPQVSLGWLVAGLGLLWRRCAAG